MSDHAPYLLDVTRLIWRRWRGRHPTGIDRVALAYLRHFGPRAQAVVQHDRFRRILDMQASQELFSLLASQRSAFKLKLLLGGIGNLTHLHGEGRGRIYLNVGHTGLQSQGFRRWITGQDVRPVYLVHDLIPITHPAYCRPGEDERHRQRMITVLRTAEGVITNSEVTLGDLSHFSASQNLSMPPSLVAWLGVKRLPVPEANEADDRPTFLTLGTIEGRKNHLLLLRIWERLINAFGEKAPRLLIIGQRGWEAEPAFNFLDRNEKLRGYVVELGGCTDEEIARHLASARAMLFPSFVEGYGLPLIEALGAGLPVIASNLPVFRELAGSVPDYLDPANELGWEQAILDYTDADNSARSAQISRIRGFHAPQWGRHFEQVESWLPELPNSRAARPSI